MVDKTLIDTSILLEPFTIFEKRNKNYKIKALSILKYPKGVNIQPVISLSVLGEIELIINKKVNIIQGEEKRNFMKDVLREFFKNCIFIGLDKKAIDLASEIINKDKYLDPLDVIHFTSAISGNCDAFLLMDDKLSESRVIKEIAKNHNLKLSQFNKPINEDKGRIDRDITWIQ